MAYSKKDSSQAAVYSRKLKENVKSILDNYIEIVNQSKVNIMCFNWNIFLYFGNRSIQLLKGLQKVTCPM